LTEDTGQGGEPAERRRILVVEDEWLIADELENMLGALGYEIMGPVPRGADALALLADGVADAAVLDISLDGHYSFPVAAELIRRKIPFLFLSGYTRSDIPAEFRHAPLLAKPVSLERLAAEMNALTG
jgi:DNA-binding response OmpR family regulator